MVVTAVCATAGRHILLERSVRFFLEQDYSDKHNLLIFNNSNTPLELDNSIEIPVNKSIHLINHPLDSLTGEGYANLGAIYNDALHFITGDVMYHHDDDDVFLPNHITEGVKGFMRAKELGKMAYKPARSWYRHGGGIDLISNTLEPSIFVDVPFLKKHGYSLETTAQHLQWVNPLVYNNLILVEEDGIPTLIYDWRNDVPTFKTSGDPHNPHNFNNYREFSQDHGDKIITPRTREQIKHYYSV